MSKSTKQAITILSVIVGGCRAAQQCFEIGPGLAALLKKADDLVCDVVVWWPITGDERDHQKYAASALNEWQAWLEEQNEEEWSIVANLAVSVRLLTDLDAMTNDREKKKRIAPLFDVILAAQEFIDPAWSRVSAYAFADLCVDELYRIIDLKIK